MLPTLLVQTQVIFPQLLELHKLSLSLRFFFIGVVKLLLPLDFKLAFVHAEFLSNHFIRSFSLGLNKLPII